MGLSSSISQFPFHTVLRGSLFSVQLFEPFDGNEHRLAAGDVAEPANNVSQSAAPIK